MPCRREPCGGAAYAADMDPDLLQGSIRKPIFSPFVWRDPGFCIRNGSPGKQTIRTGEERRYRHGQ